ncbi:MAG TPA: ProQ/FINO family protein [Candidatus Tectomicrobia bacterium]
MSDVTDTALASRTTAALELLAVLCTRYPEAFMHEGDIPRALAIGTSARLIAELALDTALIYTAMRIYTRRHAYQKALSEPGAMRIDLEGHETEPVSQEHQAAARITRPAAKAGQRTTTGSDDTTAPVLLTLDLWKGLTPMHVTATLKLVLRDIPETRESNGLVYMALENAPKGLPMGLSLESGPLYLTSPVKQWRTACEKAAEIRASGTPALLIVEAHVSTKEGALIDLLYLLF